MSYDSRERSTSSGAPFELYWFATETQTWRLTSGDTPRTYQGAIYEPEALVRTAIAQGVELKSGQVRVSIPCDHEIARLFVASIPSTPLSVVLYRGHDGEPDSEVVAFFTGRVISATLGEACHLTCAPEQEILRRSVPSPRYQRPCNRSLYDNLCGVNRFVWRVSAVVESVSQDGLTVTASELGSRPAGWFRAGYIEKGVDRRMVVDHSGSSVVLMHAMAGLAAGDHIWAYAGCDRTYSTCKNKFSNSANFFGFEWIPNKNPFSSGLE